MEKLTKEMHVELAMQGFKYFLLKDVENVDMNTPACYVMQPVKRIPHNQAYSCIGINDGMIISVMNGNTPHIIVYIEDVDLRDEYSLQ